MKTKFILITTFCLIIVMFVLISCSKNKSERLSARELALLSEMESATQSTSSSTVSTSTPALIRESIPTEQSDANKKKARASSDIVEIREKMFIAQTNEIYINKNDYIGKTIKYEGLFDQSAWRGNGRTYNYVIRFGPGCCPGDASAAGFEVVWDRGYPKKNDWVEAVGVLEEYDDGGLQSLRLALTSLSVLAKRGKERVTQ